MDTKAQFVKAPDGHDTPASPPVPLTGPSSSQARDGTATSSTASPPAPSPKPVLVVPKDLIGQDLPPAADLAVVLRIRTAMKIMKFSITKMGKHVTRSPAHVSRFINCKWPNGFESPGWKKLVARFRTWLTSKKARLKDGTLAAPPRASSGESADANSPSTMASDSNSTHTARPRTPPPHSQRLDPADEHLIRDVNTAIRALGLSKDAIARATGCNLAQIQGFLQRDPWDSAGSASWRHVASQLRTWLVTPRPECSILREPLFKDLLNQTKKSAATTESTEAARSAQRAARRTAWRLANAFSASIAATKPKRKRKKPEILVFPVPETRSRKSPSGSPKSKHANGRVLRWKNTPRVAPTGPKHASSSQASSEPPSSKQVRDEQVGLSQEDAYLMRLANVTLTDRGLAAPDFARVLGCQVDDAVRFLNGKCMRGVSKTKDLQSIRTTVRKWLLSEHKKQPLPEVRPPTPPPRTTSSRASVGPKSKPRTSSNGRRKSKGKTASSSTRGSSAGSSSSHGARSPYPPRPNVPTPPPEPDATVIDHVKALISVRGWSSRDLARALGLLASDVGRCLEFRPPKGNFASEMWTETIAMLQAWVESQGGADAALAAALSQHLDEEEQSSSDEQRTDIEDRVAASSGSSRTVRSFGEPTTEEQILIKRLKSIMDAEKLSQREVADATHLREWQVYAFLTPYWISGYNKDGWKQLCDVVRGWLDFRDKNGKDAPLPDPQCYPTPSDRKLMTKIRQEVARRNLTYLKIGEELGFYGRYVKQFLHGRMWSRFEEGGWPGMVKKVRVWYEASLQRAPLSADTVPLSDEDDDLIHLVKAIITAYRLNTTTVAKELGFAKGLLFRFIKRRPRTVFGSPTWKRKVRIFKEWVERRPQYRTNSYIQLLCAAGRRHREWKKKGIVPERLPSGMLVEDAALIEKVEAMMEKVGMTHRDLGKVVGLHHATVKRFMRGKWLKGFEVDSWRNHAELYRDWLIKQEKAKDGEIAVAGGGDVRPVQRKRKDRRSMNRKKNGRKTKKQKKQ